MSFGERNETSLGFGRDATLQSGQHPHAVSKNKARQLFQASLAVQDSCLELP